MCKALVAFENRRHATHTPSCCLPVLLLATLQTSMMRLAALVGQDFIEELFTIMNGYELVGCLVG